MLLELRNGDIELIHNTIENINSAQIYLIFKDITIQHNDIVRLFFNHKEQYKVSNNTFRVNPTSFLGRNINVKVEVYKNNNEVILYEKVMELEQYFSLGRQPYEKMPQVLVDINHEIKKLETRIEELEKEKNVI